MRNSHTPYHAVRRAIILALMILPTTVFAQSLRVIYPNGGESFQADSTIVVRWASSGINDELEIEYTTDGDNWRRIGRTGGSATSISWTIPGRVSDNVRLRVITRDEDLSDESDGTFRILESPLDATIVFAPNGGEVWTEAETRTIRWQLPEGALEALIELSTDNGSSWSTIATVPATPASYDWRLPHLSDNDITAAIIRVSISGEPDHFDISDAPFTIVGRGIVPPPDTTGDTSGGGNGGNGGGEIATRLLAPNGGESWTEGEEHAIRWQLPSTVTAVLIEVSLDSGAVWSPITLAPAVSGSYLWQIPRFSSREITGAMIRISDPSAPARVDRSDASFTIRPRPVTSSVGGIAGDAASLAARVFPNPATDRAEIRWNQNGSAEATILLHTADGSVVHRIDAGLRGGGDQALSIDLGGLAAGTYLYEIRSESILRGLVVIVR